MTMIYWIGATTSIGLLGYLFLALLKPELF